MSVRETTAPFFDQWQEIYNYAYDQTSRQTGQSFLTGTPDAYGYDNADQVASATYGAGGADNYAYDPAGNRSSASVASLGGGSITYTANNANQYTSISGWPAPSYDANGNLLQQHGVTYTWDSENKLLSVVPDTRSVAD